MAQKRKHDSEDDASLPRKAVKKSTAATEPTPISSLISRPMTLTQRKSLLKQLQSPTTISSLRRPELLLDFLTDSISLPDLSLAVPALTGLYHLITARNLDYPAFYPRLYALLDANILHSKYRSRILRHLDKFLAPANHLSSALIASFIKRLARLCLAAPPSAIVAVVPFIYNLLSQHPSTTFLIHRNPYPPYTKSKKDLGIDPYNPSEPDPEKTEAIDSSLWEIHTLQEHYHPTVAQIARVISEQFTKREYRLEDFLDHGYGTMMEGELGREAKRVVEVEYRIPKRILLADDEAGVGEQSQSGGLDLVRELFSFS